MGRARCRPVCSVRYRGCDAAPAVPGEGAAEADTGTAVPEEGGEVDTGTAVPGEGLGKADTPQRRAQRGVG